MQTGRRTRNSDTFGYGAHTLHTIRYSRRRSCRFDTVHHWVAVYYICSSLSLPLGLSLYECDVYGRWIDVSAAGATKWIFIPFVLLTIRFRLLRIECSNNRISLSALTAPHTFRGSRFAFFFVAFTPFLPSILVLFLCLRRISIQL